MPSRWIRVARFVACLALAALFLTKRSATAQEVFQGRDPNDDVRVPRSLADGSTIDRVYVHVVNPTGDSARDRKTVEDLAAGFALKAGDTFNEMIADQALRQVQKLPEVQAAEYRLYLSESVGSVQVALLVRTRPAAAVEQKPSPGMVATGSLREFPIIFQNERSQLKVTANPSFGVYTDRNAWLANPTSFNPGYDVPDALGWPEFGLEVGIGGISQVGSAPLYLYGSATYLASGTLAEDVFSSRQTRTHGEMEKLYGGLLVARKGGRTAFDLSVGRQRFNLNRNLIFGHVLGSVNGGERGASYLAPRNAQDLVVNARLRIGRTTIQGFLSDPNELPVADSRSRFAGVNFKYNDNARIDASLTLAGAIRSGTAYRVPDGRNLTRDGLRVVNPRLRWDSAFGVDGLWIEGELGHEWHADFDMSANAAGAWAGYRAMKMPWKPGILYRYSWFSGDDPLTASYERFDPLLGGVQRDWLQGLVMVKMMNNANLMAHRIEFSVKPKPGMELLVDIYKFRAHRLNNLGSARPLQILPDYDIGYEITPTIQWSIINYLFLQGLVSTKVPGKGMAMALPNPAKTWTTFQLSLYAGF